jgi:lipooligosaccharide transport system permease protein
MVTTFALPRVAVGAERTLAGAFAVTWRNIAAMRHAAYWWVVLSGFFEPLLYLLSIGIGVGKLVGDFRLANGTVVSYAQFVAPAMIASSAMNGAMAETTMNFFAKMKFMKLYDAVLATPVTPMQIALGELLWALIRGALYSAAFLIVMCVMRLTTVGWALVAFPMTLLVGFGFGGLGMACATFVRSWLDFDYINVAQFALFLFSGTFAPAAGFPPVLRVLVEVTPLYHGVELVRGFTTGSPHWSMLGHAAYLAALAAAGLYVASRRVGRLLLK